MEGEGRRSWEHSTEDGTRPLALLPLGRDLRDGAIDDSVEHNVPEGTRHAEQLVGLLVVVFHVPRLLLLDVLHSRQEVRQIRGPEKDEERTHGGQLAVMHGVMQEVVRDVHSETASDDPVRHPVRENRVGQLGERSLKRREQDWGHDESHSVHLAVQDVTSQRWHDEEDVKLRTGT